MIVGIGIDAVEIERFENWHTYSKNRLGRIFSSNEIDYCLSVPVKSAERFAARFAAKEACYKALSVHIESIGLIEFCKYVAVANEASGRPNMVISREALKVSSDFKFFVSITHTNTTAMAVIVCSNES
jgi:holo-[acyl-carrier protein] synthase